MYHIRVTFAGNPIKFQESVINSVLDGHGKAKMLSNEFDNNYSTLSFFSEVWSKESTNNLFTILPEKDLGTTISITYLKALRNPLCRCRALLKEMSGSELMDLYTHITGDTILDLLDQNWIPGDDRGIPQSLISKKRLKNFLEGYSTNRIKWDKSSIKLLIIGYGDRPQFSIQGVWNDKYTVLWKSNSPGGGVASMRLFLGEKTIIFGYAGYINSREIIRQIRDAVGRYEVNNKMGIPND